MKGFLLTVFSFLSLFLLRGNKVLLAQAVISPDHPFVMSYAEDELNKVQPTPFSFSKIDITQKTREAAVPLEEILNEQKIDSVLPFNLIKYAIRNSVSAGVPANTIILLLLLPAVASLIAASRHLVGLRGFGIFMPAALSVVFVAIGPLIGILIFAVIIFFSTFFRIVTRKLKLRLQYLPRMAMLLWFVVIGVLGLLFSAPLLREIGLTNVSIFPVLILVLLAEDFSRVQLGKSVRTALNLTAETLVLALFSYFLLTLEPLRRYALLHPESFLFLVMVINILVGRYIGLRFMEYWRFRKLISS